MFNMYFVSFGVLGQYLCQMVAKLAQHPPPPPVDGWGSLPPGGVGWGGAGSGGGFDLNNERSPQRPTKE
jgi:hypothetical protein